MEWGQLGILGREIIKLGQIILSGILTLRCPEINLKVLHGIAVLRKVILLEKEYKKFRKKDSKRVITGDLKKSEIERNYQITKFI